MVNITLRVLYRPVIDKLPSIYKEYGPDYEERILPSIGNEVMKAVVAQFNVTELITKRHEVSERISTDMVTLARTKYNLELVDIAITDLTFGKEFTHAVEQKQVAQQAAERAKELVRKAEYEKQAAIMRASGEAEAAQLISDALLKSGAGLIELRKIQASRDIATTLAKSQNVTYLPGQSNFLFTPQGR
jgi:prohibitin 1